jgi:hypothetical protein
MAGNLEKDIYPVMLAKWRRLRVSVAIVEKDTTQTEIPRHPIYGSVASNERRGPSNPDPVV